MIIIATTLLYASEAVSQQFDTFHLYFTGCICIARLSQLGLRRHDERCGTYKRLLSVRI